MALSVYIRKAVEHGGVIFPGQFCKECADHNAHMNRVSGTLMTCNQCKQEVYVQGSQTSIESCKSHKVKCLGCLRSNKSAHSFSSQYMNDPIDEDSVEFKQGWVKRFDFSPEITEELKKTTAILSVDPAVGTATVNDYTGIAITKILHNNQIYVMEAIQARLSPEKLIDKVFDLRKIYDVSKLLLETTSSQLIFMSAFKREMVKRHDFFTIEEVGRSTKESKAMRIRGMIPFYANGLVQHRNGLTDLEYQLLQFPRNSHDDIIDALAHQVPYWKKGPTAVKAKDTSPHGSLNWWKKQMPGKNTDRIQSLFGDLLK